MHMREFVISPSGVTIALVTPFNIAGQSKTIEPDLASLADGMGLNAFSRTIKRFTEGAIQTVFLSAKLKAKGPAREYYQRALQAQRDGHWALYGEEIRRLGEVLNQISK